MDISSLPVVMTTLWLLMLTSSWQLAVAQDMFYFDPSPVSQDVREGEPLRLRCDVSNRHLISFYWTFNGRALTNTTRRYQEGSDMRFSRVDRVLDSGGFRCVAVNTSTGISVRSSEARLNIIWIEDSARVQLKSPDTAADIVEGADVVLKCSIDGNPEPSVEWFVNRIKVFGNDRMKFQKNRIRIQSVTSSDNGVYTCRGRNFAASNVESSDAFIVNVPDNGAVRLVSDLFTPSLVVRAASTAVLHCQFSTSAPPPRTESASPDPFPSVYRGVDLPGFEALWYFGQQSIGESEKHYVYFNGTLLIKNIEDTDVGLYRCVARRPARPDLVYTSQLQLAFIEEMDESLLEPKALPNPQVVPAGGQIKMQCSPPKGLPIPSLRWLGPDGQPVPSSGRVSTARGGGVLSIDGAEESDRGNYTCVAENSAGIKQLIFVLELSQPPKILRSPLAQAVAEGDNVSFDCRHNGSPPSLTSLVWMKDGTDINIDSLPRYHSDVTESRLMIDDVTVDDAGAYTCKVITQGHPPVTSLPGQLFVAKKLQFNPIPSNVNLQLGSNSTVTCHAEGRTAPLITWYRSGGGSLPGHAYQRGGVMQMIGVKRSDAGQYVCVATNEQGRINATIRVDVVVRPQIRMRPGNVTVSEGQTLLLDCIASGDPRPNIQWDKNHDLNSFDLQRFQMLENGSLHISRTYGEDSGRYGCTASNSGGFDRREILLRVVAGHPKAGIFGSGAAKGGDLYINHGVDPADGSAPTLAPSGEEDKAMMMRTIVIAVCSAVAYLGIIMAVIVFCVVRHARLKKLRKSNVADSSSVPHHPQTTASSSSHVNKYGHSEPRYENQKLMMSSLLGKDSEKATEEFLWRSGNTMEAWPLNGAGIQSLLSTDSLGGANYIPPITNQQSPPLPSSSQRSYASIATTGSHPISNGFYGNGPIMLHQNNGPVRPGIGVPLQISHSQLGDAPPLIPPGPPGVSRWGGTLKRLQAPSDEGLTGFPRQQLNVIKLLGKSHYGDVILCSLTQPVNHSDPAHIPANFVVAVKSLLHPTVNNQLEFKREVELLARTNHACVAQLVGVCCSQQPSLLVTEYCDCDDLKRVLLDSLSADSYRPTPLSSHHAPSSPTSSSHPCLTPSQRLHICHQVALGMDHLASLSLVHRDLSARNVLLFSSGHVKISLLSLCRDVYSEDYYPFNDRLIPLRWMSPEAILEDRFTPQSDIWSFGIFIYEVFSDAARPYIGRTNEDLLLGLSSGGNTLTSPPRCPESMWGLVQQCVMIRTDLRPTFEEVVLMTGNIMADSCL